MGRRGIALAALIASVLTGCESGLDPTPADGSPPGRNVTTPFPIDRGDEGLGTPGKYKGLWLRLADNGQPDVTPVDTVIGVVCIGMSDSRQECADYIARVGSLWITDVQRQVEFANCSIGGHAIERWIDPEYDDELWDICLELGLPIVGLRRDQIRVVYHKAANQFTTRSDGSPLPPYPDPDSDFENFIENLDAFSRRVSEFFPKLQAVYTSSRSYGGFSEDLARSEPMSYEEGHALNTWLADHPEVNGVWFGWGAYAWAPDCSTGVSNGGGICFNRGDYEEDGAHPTPVGRGKISFLMHHRLLREDWYRR